MQIDPSTSRPDYSAMEGPSSVPESKVPKKLVYPDITIRGAAADQLIEMHAAGETFDADVTFRVTAIHSKKGGTAGYGGEDKGSSVELEIINIEKEDEPEPEEPEEDAGSAVDSYLKTKAAPAPEEED